MQRRRRIAGRRNDETQGQAYNRQALYMGHAIRFHWSGSYHVRANDALQGQVMCRLSIAGTAQQATPNIVQTEWTLALLISSWMHWMYTTKQDEKE